MFKLQKPQTFPHKLFYPVRKAIEITWMCFRRIDLLNTGNFTGLGSRRQQGQLLGVPGLEQYALIQNVLLNGGNWVRKHCG